jgi:hypothetical protein
MVPSCGLSLSWCFIYLRAAVSLCELQKSCARLLRLSVDKDAKTEEFLLNESCLQYLQCDRREGKNEQLLVAGIAWHQNEYGGQEFPG